MLLVTVVAAVLLTNLLGCADRGRQKSRVGSTSSQATGDELGSVVLQHGASFLRVDLPSGQRTELSWNLPERSTITAIRVAPSGRFALFGKIESSGEQLFVYDAANDRTMPVGLDCAHIENLTWGAHNTFAVLCSSGSVHLYQIHDGNISTLASTEVPQQTRWELWLMSLFCSPSLIGLSDVEGIWHFDVATDAWTLHKHDTQHHFVQLAAENLFALAGENKIVRAGVTGTDSTLVVQAEIGKYVHGYGLVVRPDGRYLLYPNPRLSSISLRLRTPIDWMLVDTSTGAKKNLGDLGNMKEIVGWIVPAEGETRNGDETQLPR